MQKQELDQRRCYPRRLIFFDQLFTSAGQTRLADFKEHFPSKPLYRPRNQAKAWYLLIPISKFLSNLSLNVFLLKRLSFFEFTLWFGQG